MSKKLKIMLTAFLGVLIAGVILTQKVTGKINVNAATLSTKQIIKNLGSEMIQTRQTAQEKLTTAYKTKLNSGNYTSDDPYIKVNPYGTSPLSALVLFETDEATKVSVEVVGKTAKTSIKDTTSTEYTKQHSVSVLGLYADYNNTVKLTLTTKDGQKTVKTIKVKTAALPKAISSTSLKVTKNDKTKMSIGNSDLTFLVRTTKYPLGVDADGQVRWYSTNYVQHVFKTLENGHILYLTKPDNSDLVYNDLVEADFMGRVYKEYSFSSKTGNNESSSADDETTVIHHDVIELPNHNLLLTVSDGSGKYIEDTMAELSSETGEIVKVIDLKKLLPSDTYLKYDSSKRDDGKIDWFHQNSIDYDESDQSIVISSRNQDMIMKLDYQSDEIKWIFSSQDKEDWPKEYQDLILTTTDDKTAFTGGQHAATIWDTDDANKKQLVLFNNNVAITNGDKETSKKYSEGMSYTIDEANKTIKQTWSYGKSLGTANFSNVIGSTRKMTNGNYLIDYGFNDDGTTSHIVEVDPTTNSEVFNLTFSNFAEKGYVYRAERLSLYNETYQFKL